MVAMCRASESLLGTVLFQLVHSNLVLKLDCVRGK